MSTPSRRGMRTRILRCRMMVFATIMVLCSTCVTAAPVIEIFSDGDCEGCELYTNSLRHQMNAGEIEVIHWIQPDTSHSLGRVAHDARLFAHGQDSLDTNTIVIQGVPFPADDPSRAAETTIDAIAAGPKWADLDTVISVSDDELSIKTEIVVRDELPSGTTLITVIVETYSPTPATLNRDHIDSLGRTYAFTHRFDRNPSEVSTVHTNISFDDLEKNDVDVNDLSRYRVIHFLVDEFTGDTLASASTSLQGSSHLRWLNIAPIGALLLIPIIAIGFSARGDRRRELGMPRLELITNPDGHHLDLIAGRLAGEIQMIIPKGPRTRNITNFAPSESHRIRSWSRRSSPPTDLCVTVEVEGLGIWDLTLPEDNRQVADQTKPSPQ